MATGQVTTRGRKIFLQWFQGTAMPAAAAMVLVSDTPTAATKVLSELTEVANGNGYTTGGTSLTLNSTDFDVLTEDDTDDEVEIQVKDVAWTASGGNIPASGDGPLYAVLIDDAADPNVLAFASFGSEQTVLVGNSLTVINFRFKLGGLLADLATQHEEGNADVTAGSGAMGSWAEISSALSFETKYVEVTLEQAPFGSNDPAALDIGVGAISSEAPVFNDLHVETANASGGNLKWGPYPFKIASGARVSARMSATGGTPAGRVQVNFLS